MAELELITPEQIDDSHQMRFGDTIMFGKGTCMNCHACVCHGPLRLKSPCTNAPLPGL